jgi:D-serine deaminase-like pyridoxal phosphate-dependent protein
MTDSSYSERGNTSSKVGQYEDGQEIVTATYLRPPGDIETPAVFIDLDVVDANIRRMQDALTFSGVKLRPHMKSHKSVRVARLQVEAGASGITVSSAGEAEVFADAGFDDIFIAYTVWASGARGDRIRKLHERIRLSVGVDSLAGAEQLAYAVRGVQRPLEVLIELDCGAHRTGVDPQTAGDLAAEVERLGLRVRGVFTYAGQAGRSPEARLIGANDELRAAEAAIDAFGQHGLRAEVVSAGSTPTALLSSRSPLTESRPGEYVFNDADNVRLGTCRGLEDVGLLVASTVVSTAVQGQVILDAGTKVLGREGSPERGYGQVPSIPGSFLRLLNEHHGYLSMPEGVARPSVGDTVTVVPNHACPVANLFNEYLVVRSGSVIDHWLVDARGHLY